MPDLRTITTARLVLRAVEPADLDALFAIMNDPAQWRHAPESRHLDLETTASWIERAVQRWESDGLSYWVAELQGEAAGIVGVGGAQRQSTGAWNLYWRVATAHQRRGFATEIGQQALSAATKADPTVPAIAWIRAGNEASVAVARRLQLQPQGPHADPSDGRERLAFADRPLTPQYVAQP